MEVTADDVRNGDAGFCNVGVEEDIEVVGFGGEEGSALVLGGEGGVHGNDVETVGVS